MKKPAVLVKGDHVDFVRKGDARIFAAPQAHVLVHDPKGHYFRKCDGYVCSYAVQSGGNVEVTEESMQTARRYYGNSFELEADLLAYPNGPWHRLFQLDAIRYFRAGEHEDYYRHVFNREFIRYELPVWLVEQKARGRQPVAYKIVLPDGCIWNERGLVKP